MERTRAKYLLGALILAVFFIGVGFILSRFLFVVSPVATQFGIQANTRESSYTKPFNFINPLLDCGDISNISNKSIDEMRKKITDFIDEQKTYGIDDVAVYFRDLNNGPWFGINEKDKFFPASLLKVPMMMSAFKQAMNDPSFLDKQFLWQGASRNKEYFRAAKELENNHTYTINEALSYMIKFSDNNALYVLGYAISTDTLAASYMDLGIPLPSGSDYTISARIYASFFRILYNSTFLNNEYSEKALSFLSETAFNQGIVAGVPSSSIKIAHKFGEREISSDNKQLNDCGIVYYPNKPYLLCVMVRGADYSQLTSFIAQVSKMVYQSVDQED